MGKIMPGKNFSKKDVIIKSASLLFRKKGYSSTTMRELAEAVGVEAASLYNHIGSKSEILQAICFRVASDFTYYLNNTEITLEKNVVRLEKNIRFHIHKMLHDFDEVYVANHEWKHLGEPYLADFLEQRRSYEKRLVDMINAGIAEGDIRPVDPYLTVLTLLSAVRGLEFWQHYKNKINSSSIEDEMVQLLLHGIIR